LSARNSQLAKAAKKQTSNEHIVDIKAIRLKINSIFDALVLPSSSLILHKPYVV